MSGNIYNYFTLFVMSPYVRLHLGNVCIKERHVFSCLILHTVVRPTITFACHIFAHVKKCYIYKKVPTHRHALTVRA